MDNIIFREKIPGIFAEERMAQTVSSMANHHIHEGTELYFQLEGERYYFIDQDTYLVKPGMAVLIHPNQIHKTCAIDNDNGYHRFLLQLESSVLKPFFALPSVPPMHIFEKNYWGVTEFTPEEWHQAMTIIEMIKKEMSSKTPESIDLVQLLVQQILLLFIRGRRQQEIITSNEYDAESIIHNDIYQKVHDVALYLQNHLAESCSLDELSAHFFISRSRLTRMFKSVTGFTINEYLTVYRVRSAKTLLDKTDLSITEISLRVGFGNITYFERVFKRLTGMTPMQYKKWEK